jgi:hypothetical protein
MEKTQLLNGFWMISIEIIVNPIDTVTPALSVGVPHQWKNLPTFNPPLHTCGEGEAGGEVKSLLLPVGIFHQRGTNGR